MEEDFLHENFYLEVPPCSIRTFPAAAANDIEHEAWFKMCDISNCDISLVSGCTQRCTTTLGVTCGPLYLWGLQKKPSISWSEGIIYNPKHAPQSSFTAVKTRLFKWCGRFSRRTESPAYFQLWLLPYKAKKSEIKISCWRRLNVFHIQSLIMPLELWKYFLFFFQQM